MFEEKTPELIKGEILNQMVSDIDKREGSYTSDMVGPVAYELWRMYDSLKALEPMVFVDETSGEYIDRKCADYGIARKPGLKAKTVMTFTGDEGVRIPAKTLFLTEDGLEFETEKTIAISGGQAQATAVARQVGDAFNVPANTIRHQMVSISGLNGISHPAAQGGADPESDGSLVNRLYAYLRMPATSGNVYHYEQWALAVNGVGGVKVVPLWNGPGTVKVIVVGPNKEPVSEEIQQNCLACIEENRPIGAEVTVVSAEGLTIDIDAQVAIDGSTTAEEVRTAFMANLAQYLQEISFNRYSLLYNRIAFMLLDVPGVVDYQSLSLNGGEANINLADNQVPVLGTVVVRL